MKSFLRKHYPRICLGMDIAAILAKATSGFVVVTKSNDGTYKIEEQATRFVTMDLRNL